MRCLFFLSLMIASVYVHAQNENELPLRTAYKLSLPVEKGSVYEMDVAATPYVQKQSIVQIYPGEKIYLEAQEKDGKLSLTSVRSIKDSSRTITVSCVQGSKNGRHEFVTLTVFNPFNRDLSYKAQMFLLKANKWVATDVMPVSAGLMGIETWPDVIITFGLSDWQLSSN